MSDESQEETPKNVPLIQPPESDLGDDDAAKESALIGQGKLDLVVQGCVRRMKAYTITSTELEGIETWSVIKNTAYATAFSLWSFSLGLIMQAAFSKFEELPPIAQALCYLGIPAGIIIGGVVFLIAKYLSSKSKGLREIIVGETAYDN